MDENLEKSSTLTFYLDFKPCNKRSGRMLGNSRVDYSCNSIFVNF